MPSRPPPRRPVCVIAVAAALALAQAHALAADERLRVAAYGVVAPVTLDYTATLAPVAYAEAGRLETLNEAGTGLGFELGAELRLTRRLALQGSWGRLQRDVEGRFDAQLPHPLYFDAPRAASGRFDDAGYRESATHVGLAWRGGEGRWDWRLFAGASFFRVKADVVSEVLYTHAYPYDTVQVTGTRLVEAEDSPIGAHAGASVAYALGSRFALALRFRFSRASAKLPVADAGTSELDAGGTQLAFGVQVRILK